MACCSQNILTDVCAIFLGNLMVKPFCIDISDDDSNDLVEEFKKPIKKRPLADARQAAYQAEQECKFEHMISLLEGQQ